MSNNDKGGSGSGGTGGSAGAGTDGAKNKTAKMSVDQAMAELGEARKVVGEKDQLIADLTGQLKEANDVLEGQEKAKLIGEILPRSRFKMDELVNKTTDELKEVRATLDQAILPKVNSARFGVQAADLSDREKGLTVGDRSWATEKKRKAAAGVG
jgi:hypothetical protein